MPSNNTINVLIIDDDHEFSSLVEEFLNTEGGFLVAQRHDGEAGVDAAVNELFDVILLDIGLPVLDGFEVLKEIRKKTDTPVVMLTARGDDNDKILGLETGADDYVPKPCNLKELAARIHAIMRRSNRPNEAETANDLIILGDMRIESGSQTVLRNGVVVPLTGAEYQILEMLAHSVCHVVDKNSIARRALGRHIMPFDRRVDAHISNLRKKLGPLDDGRQRIKTVRGQGYLYVTSS